LDIEMFLTAGLGDASWLIASDGEAALIDPQRDVARFLEAADRRGWRIRHVLETHVHNDYVSGALEVRGATGAEIVAPARGGYGFPHRAVDEGAAVALGSISLVAMATPGHTPEHLAWQVLTDAGGTPGAVLTGGSLLVGTAGRPDLLGAARTPELTQDQFRSLRRLARLPDSVRVLPTHGAGSFCSAGPAGTDRSSTMGRERATNELLQTTHRGRFERLLLGGLGRWPAYYAHMAPINREGAPLLGGVRTPARLSPHEVARLQRHGAWVIDGRDRWAFADAHVPGSIHIEATDSFASWVGAVVPFGAPVVLVLPPDRSDVATDLVVALSRVGYDHVLGSLEGGIDAWDASGRPTATLTMTPLGQVDARLTGRDMVRVLDVRQPTEWREGTVPGSTTIFLGDLPARLGELDADVTWLVMCRSGMRAAIAGSILAASGLRTEVVGTGGIPDWLADHPLTAAATALRA
jgi:glyoxylase-like metal-dependent hydrolase (beta-lactamase superfamily II)/rhodanese-related sulfurtransferase